MVKKIELDELQDMLESEDVDFRETLAEADAGLESICGMLNSDEGKGMVVFGVRPGGEIAGLETADAEKDARDLSSRVGKDITPRPDFSVEVIECQGRTLLSLYAERPEPVDTHSFRGREVVREGH